MEPENLMNDIEGIIKEIATIDTNKTKRDVFFEFLECAVYAFQNSVLDEKSKRFQQLEEKYKNICERYDADIFRRFPHILDCIIQYADKQKTIKDILGELFEKMDEGNSHLGQFFTTNSIAESLISNINPDIEIKKKGYVSVYEPSCGSGVNVLAMAKRIKDKGYNPQRQLLILAADVDIRCVMMTYFQCCIWGLPAIVSHKDTLRNKLWDEFYTPAYEIDLWRWKMCRNQ